MPRTEEVLTVFLASPGDLGDERNRVSDVVVAWNLAWSRHFGLRLELIRWEDDAYPSIGVDAQDVVNRQLPDDFDLFIGLMWSRFGTPTGRAGSGTKEEFDRALSRHKSSPGTVDILFYFKDAPIAPSKMDLSQLAKIQEFRNLLTANGVLFWDFQDSDQFQSLVHLHITKHVQAWRQQREKRSSSEVATLAQVTAGVVASTAQKDFEDDSGYIDFLETFNEHSGKVNEITYRIAAAQEELTEKTRKGGAEIDAMNSSSEEPSPAQIRISIAAVADAMLDFTRKVEVEIPKFRSAVDSSMNALVKGAMLGASINREHTKLTVAAASMLFSSMGDARRSTIEFRTTTANLPRMTKELNIAKREQVAVLDRLISEFENAERLLGEGLAVIEELVAEAPGATGT